MDPLSLPKEPQLNQRNPPLVDTEVQGEQAAVQRPATHPTSTHERLIGDGWAGEILALLCSCACVIALCITLKNYDHQPVPSFGPVFDSGITLGTVISLLSGLAVATALTVVQECLSQLKWLWYSGRSRPLCDMETYDQASHGLTGSLQLLWKLRLSPVASIGAILMIFQLAVSPLTQQSLLYVSESVIVPGENATVPIVKNWSEGEDSTATGDPANEYDRSISLAMKGAVLNGCFTPTNTAVKSISPVCRSGNCTFTEYQSLSICYSTADVSSHLTKLTTKTNTKYCFPSGHCLTFNASNMTLGTVTSADSSKQPSDDINRGAPIIWDSTAFAAGNISHLADFYIIYVNQSFGGPANHINAVEFVLDWCVPNYTTSVINGTVTTTQQPNPFNSFTIIEGSGEVQGRYLGVSYTIDLETHASLQLYLQQIFSGSYYLRDYSTTDADSEGVELLLQVFSSPATPNETLAGGLVELNSILANTATSMTNLMRNLGGWQAYGTISIEQTFIQVRWGWIAAPVIFTGFSILFFIAVVAMGSWRHHNSSAASLVWGSSTVAVLRAADPQLSGALGGLLAKSAMNASAREINVRLVQNSDGWRLVKAGRVAGNGDYTALDDLDHKAEPALSMPHATDGR